MANSLEKWSFSLIEADDSNRVQRLLTAGASDELVSSVAEKLERSIREKLVRFGWEQAWENDEDHRVIIQFPVTDYLFDWFFNARTGYRAQFYIDAARGLEFNKKLIERVYGILDSELTNIVTVRLLDKEFNDRGLTDISKQDLLRSLDGELSKIWYCAMLLSGEGDVDYISVSLTGPKISFGEDIQWVAPIGERENLWLDVKGAFLGNGKPYQPKASADRAKVLHEKGQA